MIVFILCHSIRWIPNIWELKQAGVKKVLCSHRRRTKTEEKAKVHATVWGTKLILFLVALATYFAPG